jgi:leucyl-tRNA synthetase
MRAAYNHQMIESKWQRVWDESGLYRTGEIAGRPKFYCLDFFPYPSGDGLHVGHCRNYIPTDVLSRYKRMRGFNVLHPMGWDAFGEPTEQTAIEHGIHPRESTDRNTANFKRQMKLLGASYDWDREIDSSRPEFYRWTQWFFLLMYHRGLAYRDKNWQWWCPTCQTTLSSHETAGGVCWRGHHGVTKIEIPAWYFKITTYADELLDGLENIDWPEKIKTMQRNWIGRSQGVEIIFKTETGKAVSVFTTRPDTLYGVTFFVLAPEHPLVQEITAPAHKTQVESYRAESIAKSEIERTSLTRQKTGVSTGSFVLNPLSLEKIPVWIADYVLPGYGGGAVMGVPAHDQRDFEFAQKYSLPVRVVIAPPDQDWDLSQGAYTGHGRMVDSGPFTSLSSEEGSRRIADEIEARGLGRHSVEYRMRDWLISRQRYWGTPIPIVYCQDCGELPVPEDQLPVLLPQMDDFRPDGSSRSPLARLPDFVNTTCPRCHGPAMRETDTMGGFACSSWYFMRFTSPHYQDGPCEPESMRYWMPVDLYVGGAEHAVLHLLYARFWVKMMADSGLVPFREPFTKLLNQGQLIGPDGFRMSKSRGNVITPDSVVAEHGADALRVYELFMAPFEQDVEWSTAAINGTVRFLHRVWNLFPETFTGDFLADSDTELDRLTHKTIRRITERIEGLRLNTMVSELMEFTNVLSERKRNGAWRTRSYLNAIETLLILLAPAAPHIAEELWSSTGHRDSVHQQPWPDWDEELAREEVLEIGVQVDGKVRDVIEVGIGAEKAEVESLALILPKVRQHLNNRKIIKVIYVKGRVLNIVTSPQENEIRG